MSVELVHGQYLKESHVYRVLQKKPMSYEQLPAELATMVVQYSTSRSVEQLEATMQEFYTPMLSYARRSFQAIFRMPAIPIAERLEFFRTTFLVGIELDAIENVNVETLVRSLETV